MLVQLTERQQRRKKNASRFRLSRKLWALVKNIRPQRDPRYLEFIRQFHCVVCTFGRIVTTAMIFSEAAHFGVRGLRQKASDRETLPLCAEHHRLGKDAAHVLGYKFFEHHDLDRDSLIRDFNSLYDERAA